MHCYRLSIEKMETMAKLHTYYITNAKTEMNYVQSNINEEELHQIFNKSLNYDDDDNDDIKGDNEVNENENEEDINEDFEEDKEEIPADYNEIIIENYFDLNNREFQQALQMDVRVVVEEIKDYDHGDKNFNIDSLLDANFNNE
jgi:hypothetical protein